MPHKLPSSVYITTNDERLPELALLGFYTKVCPNPDELSEFEFNTLFRFFAVTLQVHRLVYKHKPRLYFDTLQFSKAFTNRVDRFCDIPASITLKSLTKSEIDEMEELSQHLNADLMPGILALCRLAKFYLHKLKRFEPVCEKVAKSLAYSNSSPHNFPKAMFDLNNPWRAYRLSTYNHRRRLEIEAERQDWEASCELEDYYTSEREWKVLCQDDGKNGILHEVVTSLNNILHEMFPPQLKRPA